MAGPSQEAEALDEKILPVELQTKNVINPTYVITAHPAINGSLHRPVADPARKVQDQPYVIISEQPQQRGFRFRYECEGPSHGGLQGSKSERGRKSYPSITIKNYSGAARVVVSLVTDEKNPRSHAHKLLGNNCKNGVCTMEIPANLDEISFPNLCVLHVTRKKLVDVLTDRIIDTIKLDKKLKENNMNFEPPITSEDRQFAKRQAEEQSKTMQLNVVRLCFQVFLRNPDGSFSKMLTPVVSLPIYDSKSPGASALKICRMDKYGGCCSGNEEVFLLCEKVQKDDIQVRFVEQNPDGSVKWEAYGNFGPLDVHRQYAIVFKTPAYYNTNIDKAVNVLIMLQRKSDQEVSEPKAFTYFPQNRDKDNIASKKRKRIPLDGYDFGDGGLGGEPRPDGGDGGGGGGDSAQSMMVYQQNIDVNSLSTTHSKLPEPVTEAIDTESKLREESFQRQKTVDTLKLSVPSSPQRRFLNSQDDSDIEVDAAVFSPPITQCVTVAPQFCSKTDTKESRPSDEKRPSVDLDRPASSSSSLPECNVDTRKISKKLSNSGSGGGIEVSLEWVDSGVVPSMEDKNARKGREEVKVRRPSSSDNHSEPDIKADVVSEGVRSDEGFSETSEETAAKIQALESKVKNVSLNCQPCEGPGSRCSQLTDTMRQVTSHVAERTLSALADYAETGDIRHLLLVQRHLIAVSNENGDLPLHLSIINGQLKALRNLLDVTCTLPKPERYINALNLLRQTPLHLATILQDTDMIERLLHCGADPTIADRNGNTPAHLAIMYGGHACLRSLVKYLRPGADRADPFPELNYLNFDGYSPVHLAALSGSVDMLQTLVFGRADVSLSDGKSGKTPLHLAVENDDLPVAGYLLLEARSHVNARTFDGNTALHIACARQLVGMVALLVTAGADVNSENEEIPSEELGPVDRTGLRPIDYADDNEQIIQILLGEDCDSQPVTSILTSPSNSQTISLCSLTQPCVRPHQAQQLCALLDPSNPGKDVAALADHLGLTSQLLHHHGSGQGDPSATSVLLEYLEAQEGTLERLKEGLVAIDRPDVLGTLAAVE